jgi:translation initiation factor IF-1
MLASLALAALVAFIQPALAANSSADSHDWYKAARGASQRIDNGEIIDAQASGRGLHYVEIHQAEVVRILPDDTEGSQHQKWLVRLENGATVMAVYNTDICDRVPVLVGDVVSMGGQYIWNKMGGLIHWLHEDPKERRPHGWVEVRGVRYGEFRRSKR